MLALEAGRPGYKWDVFIHTPAARTFPIGSRFYDSQHEPEPEPFMNGRASIMPAERCGTAKTVVKQLCDLFPEGA